MLYLGGHIQFYVCNNCKKKVYIIHFCGLFKNGFLFLILNNAQWFNSVDLLLTLITGLWWKWFAYGGDKKTNTRDSQWNGT